MDIENNCNLEGKIKRVAMRRLSKIRFKNILERNISLLILNFLYVFIWAMTKGSVQLYGYGIIYSFIFIFAIRTIREKNTRLFYFSGFSIIIFWLAFFLELKVVMVLSHLSTTIFFIMVVVLLVIKLAKSKTITAIEFIEGVNIYFFLGIIGSILLSLVYNLIPDAFNASYELKAPADFIYFSFVTLTSLGYGDISPAIPLSKSIAIFISFSGQIYIAMIISMLVGKYLNAKDTK